MTGPVFKRQPHASISNSRPQDWKGVPRCPHSQGHGVLKSRGHMLETGPLHHCSSMAGFLPQPPPPPSQRAPVVSLPLLPSLSGALFSLCSVLWYQHLFFIHRFMVVIRGEEAQGAGKWGAYSLPSPDFVRAHCCLSASCQQKFYLEILAKCEISYSVKATKCSLTDTLHLCFPSFVPSSRNLLARWMGLCSSSSPPTLSAG